MSILIHSESDSSSSTSSLSKESDHDEPVLQEEPSEKPKIPLSASIMIENLKPQNQEQLNKAIAPKNDKVEKITIRFQPIGSTPSINPRVFRISPESTVSTLMKFIIKKLRIKSNTIYLYIQNSFQPTPDEVLGNLYDFFKTNNELIVSYCQTIAFG